MADAEDSFEGRTLDVRPVLRNGGEPFQVIMETVESLAPGEALRLVATFRPAPLFKVMAARGFSHEDRQREDGDWEVIFTPARDQRHAVSVSTGAEEAAGWPEPLWRLDLAGYDTPDAMARLFSRLALMEPGEVLFALFGQQPILLPKELERRGHQWVGSVHGNGEAYRMLVRVGEAN